MAQGSLWALMSGGVEVGNMFDFDKSWREAVALAAALREKMSQIEEEQSDLDVKRDLVRWLGRFEALTAELAQLREDANRGGG